MPKYEKQVHLDALKLYMEMGGMSREFLAAFGSKFGKSDTTAFRWAREGNWKARAKEPIDEAIEELKEADKLESKELIIGFLEMAQNSLDGIDIEKGYIEAIFGTAFKRIPTKKEPNPENALKVDSITDMERLVNMQVKLINAQQGWVKLGLLLAGEPDSHTEHSGSVNIAQAIMDGTYYKRS